MPRQVLFATPATHGVIMCWHDRGIVLPFEVHGRGVCRGGGASDDRQSAPTLECWNGTGWNGPKRLTALRTTHQAGCGLECLFATHPHTHARTHLHEHNRAIVHARTRQRRTSFLFGSRIFYCEDNQANNQANVTHPAAQSGAVLDGRVNAAYHRQHHYSAHHQCCE